MPREFERSVAIKAPFRLGDWVVDPRLNRLTRGGEQIQIELKMMDVLVCLAEHAGELVERQHLIDTVWATEFISENILTRAVAELRNVFGDDAKNPSFIETIHRKGYRLIASVEAVVSDESTTGRVARFPVSVTHADDDRGPYPGLAAFTEDDAEFFFGREAEVARLWRKLTARRLLAVIGPSGVGKSSFLRAGLIPATPEGWGVLVCQPGEDPLAALARTLLPEFHGDQPAMEALVGLRDPDTAATLLSRWRDRHDQALVIVDQFEELFTLNPPDTQSTVAELVGHLARDPDIHVLLSMRDDFLHRCHEHEALTPLFDALTPISTPNRAALRRALIEPAARYGFTFEEEGIVEEMLKAVEGERGALPMLAFAVGRLWEERDTEAKQLTRSAYGDIGGVDGALAQHAESTLSAIGSGKLPIVRELFRNLVTSEGTRAVREWEEILSVFETGTARSTAEKVLSDLINARLLTSYEVRDGDETPTRRVEVVHESLLSTWPRLVRWRTQDADAAQVRDQLRQAAKTWDERKSPDDLLWTGTAFREFAVWRERYPGRLSDTEQAFADAMTSLASRRRRQRRTLIAALLAAAFVVSVGTTALWRQAVHEKRRAEAAKLLALAEAQLENGPTEAMAYATASLELADTDEAREFAVRALWAGPPMRVFNTRHVTGGDFPLPAFSPDGQWLAVAGLGHEYVLVYGESGGPPIVLGGHKVASVGPIRCAWTRDGLLVTGHPNSPRVRLWSIPEGTVFRSIDLGGPAWWQVGEKHLLAEVGWNPQGLGSTGPEGGVIRLRRWELPHGEVEDLGLIDWAAVGTASSVFSRDGRAWIYAKGDRVYSRPLPFTEGTRDNIIARHSSEGVQVGNWLRPHGFYSSDNAGNAVLWSTPGGDSAPGHPIRKPESATTRLVPEPNGRWAIALSENSESPSVSLWDIDGLADAEPLKLRRGEFDTHRVGISDFHPEGEWVVVPSGFNREFTFWPLSVPFPAVVGDVNRGVLAPALFTPDGAYLVSRSGSDRLRLRPLPGSGLIEVVELTLPEASSGAYAMAIDSTGDHVIYGGYTVSGCKVILMSLKDEESRYLDGFPNEYIHGAVGFSPSGRFAAAASFSSDSLARLQVWDLETGESRAFDQPKTNDGPDNSFATRLAFVDETTLYTCGGNGLIRWNTETGKYEQFLSPPPGGQIDMSVTSDRRQMLTFEVVPLEGLVSQSADLRDMSTGQVRSLSVPRRGRPVLSPDGSIWASAGRDGIIQVGSVDGGEPHLLFGHEGRVGTIAISSDLRWIASMGLQDSDLRLWPMPDLSKPPLHTLPREQLIAKLKTLTNLRVVHDEDSATGWKLTLDPFPGWAEVPEW